MYSVCNLPTIYTSNKYGPRPQTAFHTDWFHNFAEKLKGIQLIGKAYPEHKEYHKNTCKFIQFGNCPCTYHNSSNIQPTIIISFIKSISALKVSLDKDDIIVLLYCEGYQ